MINDLVAACKERPVRRYPLLIGFVLLILILGYLKYQQEVQRTILIEDYIQQEENWIL